MKPMSDLCWTCQQNSAAVIRMANCSEEEKSDVLKVAEEHLRVVEVERKFYKSTVEACRQSVRAHYTVNGEFQPPPLSSQIPPNSVDISVHYSFDYAQQVHFPCNPQQPGPLYFLTPRKCSIFGMNDEALPRQVHFLCDEAGECGKGANVVGSRTHYFLENHGHGEKTVYLHADNCTGQNKNSTVIHIGELAPIEHHFSPFLLLVIQSLRRTGVLVSSNASSDSGALRTGTSTEDTNL